MAIRSPFSWSIPLGRRFGITIQVHWLFPVFALGMILRVATQKDAVAGAWIDARVVLGLLFVSVLLHDSLNKPARRANAKGQRREPAADDV